jgi:TP901 family phage tail tape measure protein
LADRVVKVSLTAQVSNYLAGMEKARLATANAGSEAEKAAKKIEAQNQVMQAAGRGLLAVGVVAIAATALSVKAAIGWETAWTGVTKTVEGTPAELAKVEEGLRSLAKTLPASHEQIAAVAEAAGQLGIKTASVTAFTKTMIDLGETTNLSAEEAATSLARFMNVMGTSQDDVGRLGSAIVELGNNYATTEAEILAMASRLSGAGVQIGLSEGEVLGLATALSSVGIEAEAGGSAISKVMIDIAGSVDAGGERVQKFAEISGVSAADFTAQWESDPGAALAGFVKGLGDAELQGTSTLGVLEDLGITEVRMRDALLRAAAASDDFSAAMGTGNKAFDENNALAEEAAKRYATVESQLQVMNNRVKDAAISYGEIFLPAVSAAADGVGNFADMIGDLDPVTQTALTAVIVLGGAAATAGGLFLLAVPKVVAFRSAIVTMGPGAQRAARGVAAVAKAAGALAVIGIGAALLDTWKTAAENAGTTAADLANALETAGSSNELLMASFKDESWLGLSVSAEKLTGSFGDLVDQVSFAPDQRWMGALGDAMFALDPLSNHLRNQFEDLGAEIANMTPEAASATMNKLVDDYDLTNEQITKLIDLFPAYRESLVEQATAANRASTDSELLKIALEGVDGASGDAESATRKSADAYLEASDMAGELDDRLRDLMGTMQEANGKNRDAVSANGDYQQSLLDAKEQVKQIQAETDGYARTLDQTTQEGIDNYAILVDLAQANEDAALAQFELDGNTEKYKQTLIDGHQNVLDQANAMTSVAGEADGVADSLAGIPTDTQINLLLEDALAKRNLAEMERQLEAFTAKWSNTPITFDLFMDTSGGNRTLAASAARYTAQALAYGGAQAEGGILPGVPSATDNMFIHAASGEFVTNAKSTSDPANRRALEFMNNGGTISGYANGGIVRPQYVSSSGGGGNYSTTSGDTFQATFQLAPAAGRSISEQAFEAARRMKIRR